MKFLSSLAFGFLLLAPLAQAENVSLPGRWPEAKASDWYQKQPWWVGCNFTPSTAINQLEMWQAETFDPQTIDRELGWAAGMGMNTVRVYLHDLVWQQDGEAFLERIDRFSRYRRQARNRHHAGALRCRVESASEAWQTTGAQAACA